MPVNALLPVFGGPAGAHARRSGPFFHALPWAIVAAAIVFTLVYLRHLPCLTTNPDNPINAYIRVCYSDVQVNYSYLRWAEGVQLLGLDSLQFSPLLAMFITLAAATGRVLGWRFDDVPAHEYVGLPHFFAANTILLFACLLGLVVATGILLRREGRPWDVMLIGASPVVFAAGLTNWDLFPLALVALGLLALEARRTLEAGIVLGLAASAATMPLAFVVGIVVALGLRREWSRLALFAGPFAVTWLVIHVPQAVVNFDSLVAFYLGQVQKDVGYGSLWFLLSTAGVPMREVGALLFVVALLIVAVLLAWLYVTDRRPRATAVSAAIVLILVFFAPAVSPQMGLWVVVALLLARPADALLWAFSFVQLVHYLAVWGRLGGHLTVEQSGPWVLYPAAVLLRIGFELVFLALILRDLRRRPAAPEGTSTEVTVGVATT